jgi:hypothetical protein
MRQEERRSPKYESEGKQDSVTKHGISQGGEGFEENLSLGSSNSRWDWDFGEIVEEFYRKSPNPSR